MRHARPPISSSLLLALLLAAHPACALLQRGPIKADPPGASAKQVTAAANLRQARDKAVQQPASAEAARDYVTALAEAIESGLRREAIRWDWDKLMEEGLQGVDRTCGRPLGAPDVCATAVMQQARLLWAGKRPGEAVKAARHSMEIKPTLETAGLLIQMYDERNNHEPVIALCDSVKELIRAEPQDRRIGWLRLCMEQSRTRGDWEKALGWLTPGELKEARAVIEGQQELDRFAGLIRRAKEESDKVRRRAFNLDRQWRLIVHARCAQRMYLVGQLNPWAEGANVQPLDKGTSYLPVSMGAVLWIFDANKKPVHTAAVIDERSIQLDVDCHDYLLN
jgi:hypothetical protein